MRDYAICHFCGDAIWMAADGAWEDSRGACGCGDDEHYPGSRRQEVVNA